MPSVHEALGGGRKQFPKKDPIPYEGLTHHIRLKIINCLHQWIANLLYESGQSCVHCGISIGMYTTYMDHQDQLTERIKQTQIKE